MDPFTVRSMVAVAIARLDAPGFTVADGARWMRGHYLLRAWKQRHEPAEKAQWVTLAREAHRIVMGRPVT